MTNLLSNAIKYTPEKGTVSFEANEQSGQIILTVLNNGNTLSDVDLPKLFERFYQSLHNSEGAGIGLALVKELAVLSHGNIIANTLNEDEIQFTVTLPIEQSYFSQNEVKFEEPLIIEKPNKLLAVKINNHQTLKNDELPLLLIIDDDADIRQFIASIFRDSYRIKEAKNGEQGINKAFKFIPDLIISDIMMPVTDGIEVCNRLKYDQRTSHIPIILLTARVGDQNEIIGLKTGADAYITKPFNSDKLKIRVENLIELRQQLQKRYQQEFEFQSNLEVRSTVEQQFLKQLHEVLDAHISDPKFKSDNFCDKMLMSRMQLHRKLKALTGLSTSEFIKSQRVKLAASLLKESDLTISEVAYEVGFNTPSYFSKCFKEVYHCTPNEYLSK